MHNVLTGRLIALELACGAGTVFEHSQLAWSFNEREQMVRFEWWCRGAIATREVAVPDLSLPPAEFVRYHVVPMLAQWRRWEPGTLPPFDAGDGRFLINLTPPT